VLGLTQGLSEFLPISSSGHLILVPWLFHWTELTRDPHLNKTFDVALHMGTLAAAIVYFWSDVRDLVSAGLRSIGRRRIETPTERFAWLLLLSAVPGAIAGAIGESAIEDHLGQPWLIGVMLIVFALVLSWADTHAGTRAEGEFSTRDAVVMGTAQMLALQPGVSRSGITISAGRTLGFDRDSSARLSFLMMIPIIGGAGLEKLAKLMANGGLASNLVAPFAVGLVVSAVSGYAAVRALLNLVRRGSFRPFVFYRIAAGAAVLIIAATPWR